MGDPGHNIILAFPGIHGISRRCKALGIGREAQAVRRRALRDITLGGKKSMRRVVVL